jgi:CheY-like chemotaxis protein
MNNTSHSRVRLGTWLPPAILAVIGILLAVSDYSNIKELPRLIWALLGCYIVWLLREPIVALAGRIETFKVKGIGVEVKLAQEALEDALIDRKVKLTGIKRKATMDRLSKERQRLLGAEILWVDDIPSGNRNEARALQFGGAAITFAASTDEALAALKSSADSIPFDLILSDMKRDEDTRAGLTMIDRFREIRAPQPLIFYVGEATQPPPDGAIGITSSPDELLVLVLNALRGRAPITGAGAP